MKTMSNPLPPNFHGIPPVRPWFKRIQWKPFGITVFILIISIVDVYATYRGLDRVDRCGTEINNSPPTSLTILLLVYGAIFLSSVGSILIEVGKDIVNQPDKEARLYGSSMLFASFTAVIAFMGTIAVASTTPGFSLSEWDCLGTTEQQIVVNPLETPAVGSYATPIPAPTLTPIPHQLRLTGYNCELSPANYSISQTALCGTQTRRISSVFVPAEETYPVEIFGQAQSGNAYLINVPAGALLFNDGGSNSTTETCFVWVQASYLAPIPANVPAIATCDEQCSQVRAIRCQ